MTHHSSSDKQRRRQQVSDVDDGDGTPRHNNSNNKVNSKNNKDDDTDGVVVVLDDYSSGGRPYPLTTKTTTTNTSASTSATTTVTTTTTTTTTNTSVSPLTPTTPITPSSSSSSSTNNSISSSISSSRQLSKKIELTYEKMSRYFNCPQPLAARLLGVSLSTLKRRFYELGLGRVRTGIGPLLHTTATHTHSAVALSTINNCLEQRKRSIYFLVNHQDEDAKHLDSETISVLQNAFRRVYQQHGTTMTATTNITTNISIADGSNTDLV